MLEDGGFTGIGRYAVEKVRFRWIVVLAVLMLVASACGGGESGEAAPATEATAEQDGDEAAPETTAAQSVGEEDTAGEEASGEPAEDPASPGERSGVITIDGESTKYDFDDLTFSHVEGVDDITFETCSPDFFGSGRFYALGYAVDDGGELILGEDGGPAGLVSVDLPPDDWEATERDAPSFEINLNGLEIEMAMPEEAAGGEMAWTIDDTTASGTAVFVDFENTYTVEFNLVCEGEPTVNVDDLPEADDGDDGGDNGGFPLVGAGVGSFTADGESFDNVDVYRCEPFSFGQDPHPDDLSLVAFLGGSNGLEVEIGNSQGIATTGGMFDQVTLSAFYSRSGDAGLEQFEGRARNDADGSWYLGDPFDENPVELPEPPFSIDGDRISGSLSGLEQTWPDEGAALVDVTFDMEIPTEVNTEC